MKTLSLELTDEEHALLSDLAASSETAPEDLLRRSVDSLLDERRAYVAFVREGACSAREEPLIDADEVDRQTAALLDELDRRAVGVAAE